MASDLLNVEAQNGLLAAVGSLFPPSLQVAVRIFPSRIVPVGLGGFIADSVEPRGEILGRHIDAEAVVTVGAKNLKDLDDDIDEAIRAVLTTERGTLVTSGIYRIALAQVSEERAPQGPGKTGTEKDIRFDVHYEFVKRPAEAGEFIEEIPIELQTG